MRYPVIGSEGRQRTDTIGAEAIARSLAGLTMQALVGDLVQPFARLAIDIGGVGKLAEGLEVLAEITDAATFHFAFLPTRGRVAGSGVEVTLAGEAQKRGLKGTKVPTCSATTVRRLSYQNSRATPPRAWKA